MSRKDSTRRSSSSGRLNKDMVSYRALTERSIVYNYIVGEILWSGYRPSSLWKQLGIHGASAGI